MGTLLSNLTNTESRVQGAALKCRHVKGEVLGRKVHEPVQKKTIGPLIPLGDDINDFSPAPTIALCSSARYLGCASGGNEKERPRGGGVGMGEFLERTRCLPVQNWIGGSLM